MKILIVVLIILLSTFIYLLLKAGIQRSSWNWILGCPEGQSWETNSDGKKECYAPPDYGPFPR